MQRALIIVMLSLQLVTSGCAVFNRDNTPALNLVERKLFPEDKTARLAAYPVLIPLSLAAVTLDMVLLHPASQIPKSWKDTRESLWDDFQWENMYVTESAALPLRVAATPVIFGGSFLARSTLDISRKGGDPRLHYQGEKGREDREKKAGELLDQAERAFVERRVNDVQSLLEKAEHLDPDSKRAEAIRAASLLEGREYRKLSTRNDLRRGMNMPFFLSRFAMLLPAATPAEQMQLMDILSKRTLAADEPTTGMLLNATIALMQADDRAVRLKAVQTLGRLRHHAQARDALKSIAGGNDAVLAAEAGIVQAH